MFSVGLTGGIGSGKSLVADLLARRGAAIVDTDAIAHDLTRPGGGAIGALRARFGAEFITADGALDRARMRAQVFTDPASKERLEAILHPLIRAAALARAQALPAATPYVVFAVPLLVEARGWRGRVDRVLVVDTPVATQLARITDSRHVDASEAARIVAQQATRTDRLAAADDIVFNDTTIEALELRIDRLHALYVDLAGRPA
jgi:dephospho-CoA kinase